VLAGSRVSKADFGATIFSGSRNAGERFTAATSVNAFELQRDSPDILSRVTDVAPGR